MPGAAADIQKGRELLQAELDLEPIFTPRRAAGCRRPVRDPGYVDFARLSPEEAGRRPAQAIAAGGRVGVMFDHAEMGDEELERADELLRLPFTARLITELA